MESPRTDPESRRLLCGLHFASNLLLEFAANVVARLAASVRDNEVGSAEGGEDVLVGQVLYLLFARSKTLDLDQFVSNTEAHPIRKDFKPQSPAA